MKTVLVSGCFDLVHPGHVIFLQAAAAFGDLHVSVASDKTITNYKGHPPLFPEHERQHHVLAFRCVHRAFIASGSGELDFKSEMIQLQPDVFIVNEDGDYLSKQDLCNELGVEYRVLCRGCDGAGIPLRSSTVAKLHLERFLNDKSL